MHDTVNVPARLEIVLRSAVRERGFVGGEAHHSVTDVAWSGVYKYAIRQTFCIETGDDPDEHSSAPMERKKASTEKAVDPNFAAKNRLIAELKDHYKDGAAVAGAMKIELAIAFDVAKYDVIKAELIKRANGHQN